MCTWKTSFEVFQIKCPLAACSKGVGEWFLLGGGMRVLVREGGGGGGGGRRSFC